MGECLEVLDREQESPLDAILTQQVKIHRIIENANLALVRHVEGVLVSGMSFPTDFGSYSVIPHHIRSRKHRHSAAIYMRAVDARRSRPTQARLAALPATKRSVMATYRMKKTPKPAD